MHAGYSKLGNVHEHKHEWVRFELFYQPDKWQDRQKVLQFESDPRRGYRKYFQYFLTPKHDHERNAGQALISQAQLWLGSEGKCQN